MKSLRTAVFALACASMLVACATGNGQDTRGIEYTCASAAAALRVLVAVNAELSVTARQQVTRAAAVLNPVCSQPSVPTLGSSAQAALGAALVQLNGAVATVSN